MNNAKYGVGTGFDLVHQPAVYPRRPDSVSTSFVD